MRGLQQRYNCTTKQTEIIEVEIPVVAAAVPSLTFDEQIDKRLKEKGLIA